MLGPALNGILGAILVCGALYMGERLPEIFEPSTQAWLLLLFTALVAFVQWVWIDRRSVPRTYHGAADMLVQIHSPSTPDSPSRWIWLGVVSWCLSWLSGNVGIEGGATEWAFAGFTAFRSRSARWFEQRRRTDTTCALSAGLAAAFGSPFAAVLVPIELGVGGRTLSAVVAAVVASFGVRVGCSYLGVKILDLSGVLDGVDFASYKGWLALAVLGFVAGLLGAGFLKFSSLSRKSLSNAVPSSISGRILVVGIFLFLISWIHPLGSMPSHSLLQDFFLTRIPSTEAGVLFFSRTLSLVLLMIGFGTVGVFWPLFVLGGLFGFASHVWLFEPLMHGWFPEIMGFAPLLALAGASSLWASVLGLPIAGSVLIFELTGDIRAAILCLGASLIAQRVARKLSQPLLSQELESKGLTIVEGRSLSILQDLKVRDAMVTDHETIHEQESVTTLPERLLASRYPFLPVVRGDGIYTGLVTIDMVQDRLAEVQSSPGISQFFEVKDLLYRSGARIRTLKPGDSLTATRGLFQDIPCVPVIGDDGRVQGLLFVHHVRLTYDREVARRSLRLNSTAPEFRELIQPVTE